ncbi:MAG: hypothetical protein R3Y24_09130 [Eubacteriales bacterium]
MQKRWNRILWCGCLLLLLAVVGILTKYTHRIIVLGVPVISQQQLEEITSDKIEMTMVKNMQELLSYDNAKIPYDQYSNTFYLSQPIKSENYLGIIKPLEENCTLYFIEETVSDIVESMETGISITLLCVVDNQYTKANLVITGLPVMEIKDNTMILYTPDDVEVDNYTIKESMCTIDAKISGKYTIKLRNEAEDDKKELSLIGMTKGDEWKLVPIEDENLYLREKITAYIWNLINDDNSGNNEFKLDVEMEYVEVIYNNQYLGLMLLMSPQEENEMNLLEDDSLYECSDEAPWEENIFTVENIDVENFIDYHLWAQCTYSVKSMNINRYVIESQEKYYKVPRSYMCSLGELPKRYAYIVDDLSGELFSRMLEDEDLNNIFAEEHGEIDGKIAEMWSVLRSSCLTTEKIVDYAEGEYLVLEKSGIYSRNNNEQPFSELENLTLFIENRLDALDSYYANY